MSSKGYNHIMDIVLPYVNCDDLAWQKIFLSTKYPTMGKRAQQLMLKPYRKRFASYGLFKYWWRALDKYFPDLGKVHLLLMQESQFPDFLNPADTRICVHYHREFMPANLCPSFNSSAIELCAIHSLPLTNTFLLVNDDMYFNQLCTANCFEKDGHPLTKIAIRRRYGSGIFQSTLANGQRLASHHANKPCPAYAYHHLFQAYDANYCKKFLDKEWPYIVKHLGRFRDAGDTNHMCLMMAQNLEGISIDSEAFPYRGYYECPDLHKVPYNELLSHRVICLNDVNSQGIETARAYLEKRYPAKCSFEL